MMDFEIAQMSDEARYRHWQRIYETRVGTEKDGAKPFSELTEDEFIELVCGDVEQF